MNWRMNAPFWGWLAFSQYTDDDLCIDANLPLVTLPVLNPREL